MLFGQENSLHHHAGIEIIYSRNKKIIVTVDGKKICLNPGEFVLISSEALHSVMPSSGSVQQDIMYVSFQSDYLQQMSPYLRNHEISRDSSKTTEEAKIRLAELCEQLREYAEKSSESEARHFETNQILFAMLQMIYIIFAWIICKFNGDCTHYNSFTGNISRLCCPLCFKPLFCAVAGAVFDCI